MTELQFTHCNKCKKDYLVGINGKDITKAETSGGKMCGECFMAISNDEVDNMPKLPKEVKCKNCGEICKVTAAIAK